MPNVDGKKFPYTTAGKMAAKKAAAKKKTATKPKSMIKKRTPANGNYSRGY
jgi:hypothetical protein